MKIVQYCQRRCKHVELEQFWHAFASRGFDSDSWAFLLPARRYASAGLRDSNVPIHLSVCHTPVLCQNEENYDFFTVW